MVARVCDISKCFQRAKLKSKSASSSVRLHSKEALLNRIDSTQYGSGRVVHSRGATLKKNEEYLRSVHLNQPHDFMEAPEA